MFVTNMFATVCLMQKMGVAEDSNVLFSAAYTRQLCDATPDDVRNKMTESHHAFTSAYVQDLTQGWRAPGKHMFCFDLSRDLNACWFHVQMCSRAANHCADNF